MKEAKVWVNNEFRGIYPVGTSAVVVAASKEHACQLLKAKAPHPDYVKPEQFREIPLTMGYTEVLQNGDY